VVSLLDANPEKRLNAEQAMERIITRSKGKIEKYEEIKQIDNFLAPISISNNSFKDQQEYIFQHMEAQQHRKSSQEEGLLLPMTSGSGSNNSPTTLIGNQQNSNGNGNQSGSGGGNGNFIYQQQQVQGGGGNSGNGNFIQPQPMYYPPQQQQVLYQKQQQQLQQQHPNTMLLGNMYQTNSQKQIKYPNQQTQQPLNGNGSGNGMQQNIVNQQNQFNPLQFPFNYNSNSQNK
jgi:hypothetical protein